MKEGQVIKIHILINKQLLYYSEEESSFLFSLQNILIEFLYIYRSAKKQLFFLYAYIMKSSLLHT